MPLPVAERAAVFFLYGTHERRFMKKKYTYEELLEKVKELDSLASDYKNAEENFFKERDFNKILIEASPAFYVAISAEGKTLLMNQAMLAALGYTADEVIGKDYMATFVPKNDHVRLSHTFEIRMKSQKPTVHENHVVTKDGRNLLVEWHGRSIMKSNGAVDFFFGVGIDITERRAAEIKLRQAFVEIKKLKDQLEAENIFLRQEIKIATGHQKIIGQSRAIKNLLSQMTLIAKTDSIVLILGETGTGKELVADALHSGSARSKGPFIKVNCSALTETILESELFGHVKGAFSGAVKDKIGRIQAAEGGTIFLDEIGDISPHIQVKLLRFLDNKEYECVGESKTRKANVRIVAGTNADLKKKVSDGAFRSDLFYRLNIMVLHLPPLREREGDIPILVNYFIAHYASLFGKEIAGVDDGVMKIFLEYRWPGNVRELKHTVEHACLLCRGKIIRVKHLPLEFQNHQLLILENRGELSIEAERIRNAMEKASWKKATAARLLGIHRSTLYRLMDRYRISRE